MQYEFLKKYFAIPKKYYIKVKKKMFLSLHIHKDMPADTISITKIDLVAVIEEPSLWILLSML